MTAERPATAGLFDGRLRVMQWVADASILWASATFALVIGQHWSWGPAALTVVFVTAAFGINSLLARRAIAAFDISDELRGRLAAGRRQRATIVVPAAVALEVGPAVIAGSIPSYGAATAIGVSMVVMVVWVRVVVRRWITRRIRRMRATRHGAVG